MFYGCNYHLHTLLVYPELGQKGKLEATVMKGEAEFVEGEVDSSGSVGRRFDSGGDSVGSVANTP